MTRRPTSFPAALAAALLLLPVASSLQAEAPAIVPGQDPGGIAIAVIASDIDFQRPDVLPRLARDGEGLAIAWDFSTGLDVPPPGNPTQGAAEELLSPLARRHDVRLILVRFEPEDLQSLAKAVSFASRTPAALAIVASTASKPEQSTLLEQASHRFPGLAILAPAPPPRKDETKKTVKPDPAQKPDLSQVEASPSLWRIAVPESAAATDSGSESLIDAVTWLLGCAGQNKEEANASNASRDGVRNLVHAVNTADNRSAKPVPNSCPPHALQKENRE